VKLVVTIPAYNEAKTIGAVIRDIPRKIEGVGSVEVLVVDDGSTEDTVMRAKEAGADHVVSHKKNEGLGFAFRDGLDAALRLGADIVVNIDADGQYDPKDIPALIEPLLNRRADIVLSWRDIDNLEFMPIGKKIGNKLATWLTRTVTGMPIKDAQSGFRAFSKEAALRTNLSGKYTYVQETIMQAKFKGLCIEQMPAKCRARQDESRLIKSLLTYARRAGKVILITYWHYHPLRIFSAIAAILILAGSASGIEVLVHISRSGTLSPQAPVAIVALILIVTGIQALILGLFAETIKTQRMFQEEILYRLKRGESNGNSGL